MKIFGMYEFDEPEPVNMKASQQDANSALRMMGKPMLMPYKYCPECCEKTGLLVRMPAYPDGWRCGCGHSEKLVRYLESHFGKSSM